MSSKIGGNQLFFGAGNAQQTIAGNALQAAGHYMRETRETVRETHPHTPIGVWRALLGSAPTPLEILPSAINQPSRAGDFCHEPWSLGAPTRPEFTHAFPYDFGIKLLGDE